MFAKLKNESLKLLPIMLFCCLLTIAAEAQTVSSNGQSEEAEKALTAANEEVKAPVLMPVWKNYKNVTIGMTADEVKENLGKAEIADKDGFYYKFSDDETAQIVLDADKKVRAITIIYKMKGGNPPKFEDILGVDPTVEPNENGAVYKLVRYPEAGYWVAYNRTAGDNATVSVTVSKL